MPRRWPGSTGDGVNEAYREWKQQQQELDELLQTSTRRKQRLEQPQTPEQPQRKRKEGGGRDQRFDPKQQTALQREHTRFTEKNLGKFKYEVMEHLRLWTKKKFKLAASPSPGTIRKYLGKPL